METCYKGEREDEQTVESFLSIWLTVKLQLNAQYYVINRHSNLLHEMWVMGNNMDCNWNQGANVDVDETRSCINTGKLTMHGPRYFMMAAEENKGLLTYWSKKLFSWVHPKVTHSECNRENFLSIVR